MYVNLLFIQLALDTNTCRCIYISTSLSDEIEPVHSRVAANSAWLSLPSTNALKAVSTISNADGEVPASNDVTDGGRGNDKRMLGSMLGVGEVLWVSFDVLSIYIIYTISNTDKHTDH